MGTLLEFFLMLNFLLVSLASKVCIVPGDEEQEFIHVDNVDLFHGCTTIDGSVRIVQTTFDGDPFFNRVGMHPDKLYAFKDVTEITGYLLIQGFHPHFNHLDYFSNLTVILGTQVWDTNRRARIAPSLSVAFTSLKTVDLISLEQITFGDVVLVRNPNLCYVTRSTFASLVTSNVQRIIVKMNRLRKLCAYERKVCSDRCLMDVCWNANACVGGVEESNSIEDLITMIMKPSKI